MTDWTRQAVSAEDAIALIRSGMRVFIIQYDRGASEIIWVSADPPYARMVLPY